MRLVLSRESLLQSGEDGRDVVTVDSLYLPAKRRPLVLDRLDTHDLFGGAVGLLVVAIDEGEEVVQAIMGSGQGRFPGSPFLEFAIGEQTEDPCGPSIQAHA